MFDDTARKTPAWGKINKRNKLMNHDARFFILSFSVFFSRGREVDYHRGTSRKGNDCLSHGMPREWQRKIEESKTFLSREPVRRKHRPQKNSFWSVVVVRKFKYECKMKNVPQRAALSMRGGTGISSSDFFMLLITQENFHEKMGYNFKRLRQIQAIQVLFQFYALWYKICTSCECWQVKKGGAI